MNRFLLALLLLVLAGSVTACGDDDPTGLGGDDDPDLLIAATIARNASLLTEITASVVAASAAGVVTDAATPKAAGACPDVAIGSDRQNQTVTIFIDAGSGCSWNGRTVRGSIAITVVQGQGDAPTHATAAFDAFSVEDRGITGTVVTEITLDDATAIGTATTDLTVVDAVSTTALEGSFSVEAATGRTPDLSDNTAVLSGTARVTQGGLVASNSNLTIPEASPLALNGTCAYPQSGILQAEVTSGSRTLPPVTIDFQPVDGGCDSMASIAVAGTPAQTVDFMDLIGDFN